MLSPKETTKTIQKVLKKSRKNVKNGARKRRGSVVAVGIPEAAILSGSCGVVRQGELRRVAAQGASTSLRRSVRVHVRVARRSSYRSIMSESYEYRASIVQVSARYQSQCGFGVVWESFWRDELIGYLHSIRWASQGYRMYLSQVCK